MSVIVAKSNRKVCSTPTYNCFPAVTEQVIVPAGATVFIDGLLTDKFAAGKWFITLATSDDRLQGYELYATHRNGTSPTHVIYGEVGSLINHTTNVVINASRLTLTIENNESIDLLVCFTRVAVPKVLNYVETLDVVEVGNLNGFVPANTSGSVDFIGNQQAIGVKWVVAVTTSTGERSSAQVYASLGTTVQAVTYGFIGDQLAYSIDVEQVAGFGYNLVVSNLTSNPIRVDITRVPIQLTTGVSYCGPSAGLDLWIPQPVTVQPTQTTTVDTLSTTQAYAAAKWLAVLSNTTNQTMAFEVASVESGVTSDTMYAIISDYFDVDVETVVSGQTVQLNVTNNQPDAITVRMLRIPVAL